VTARTSDSYFRLDYVRVINFHIIIIIIMQIPDTTDSLDVVTFYRDRTWQTFMPPTLQCGIFLTLGHHFGQTLCPMLPVNHTYVLHGQ